MITQDISTFTTLAKIYSSEYFCNARVAGIGEIFVQRKFSAIRYLILALQLDSPAGILLCYKGRSTQIANVTMVAVPTGYTL